jgi:AraC-like DNA-binding protein
VDCVPLFAFGNFGAVRPGAKLHVHSGCVEVCLCLKGNVRYETDGVMYPVLPGHVFISRPDEPHRRCDNPKGMMLYRILFSMPKRGECILGLSAGESAFIAKELKRIPFRAFHATTRLRAAFVRLFAVFDANAADKTRHQLEMRNATLELLLALIEAPYAPHSAKGRPTAKVKEIARRIADSPELEYPVAALAREAALSSFAFTEAFKRATGLTPHAYLVDQRVRRAHEDLKAHKGSIRSVSMKWHFSSPQHMAVAFKRVLGITPSMVI